MPRSSSTGSSLIPSLTFNVVVVVVAVFLLASFTSAELCPLTSQGLSGIGEEIALTALGKVAVLEFSPTVQRVTLAAGAAPYVKILAASEQPSVYTDEAGVLTIAPEADTCDATHAPTGAPTIFTPSDTTTTTGAPTDSPVAASSAPATSLFPTALFGLTISMGALRGQSAWTTLALLASLTSWANGDSHLAADCKKTIEIEIGQPEMAPATVRFGETDHYLAATNETVVWGYYDPTATKDTAPLTMASGETVTVEVITHHSGHDYAKMIMGDPAIENIFYWESTQSALSKPEPKLPGSGVHLVTGPIAIEGAMPGDVVKVEILELDPRPNPLSGRTFGTNSQKFAGYHFRLGEKRDGTPYTRAGGTEAITVMEFIEDADSNMLYGMPCYMYRWPNLTIADGSTVTFDGNPAVVVPHEFDMKCDGTMSPDPIMYPPGFDDISVIDEGGIVYMNPDPAELDWKVPLRPHLGTLGVMPSNSANYIDSAATGGASTIPPSRFGGNVDDWRIGKGGTMYYRCELEGCLLLAGDTHAALGDSELAGTAMETSMTAKLRVTLEKADALPAYLTNVDWPLLETSTLWVVHGFAFANYLDELADASTIFAEGASIDAAMEDCYYKTRNWLMDAWDLIEEETIAIMTMSVDFGVTQVVDGNWGAHATIPKFVFDDSGEPFDYTCTTSMGPGRRHLSQEGPPRRRLKLEERRDLFQKHSGNNNISMDDYKRKLFTKVTKSCATCGESSMRDLLADKLLDTKLHYMEKMMQP